MGETDPLSRSWSRTKESRVEEKGRVKGTYWKQGGGREKGGVWKTWTEKDDRSEGYHAHGFHHWASEHETGRKKTATPHQRPTQTTAAIHITVNGKQENSLTHISAMERTTLCIPLLTQSFHITSNHSHYSHKPHVLSCAQAVTEGHGTLPQPNTHNHKDHN